MDFNNRSPQPAASPSAQHQPATAAPKHSFLKNKKKDMWSRAAIVAALACVVILLVGIIALMFANNNNTKNDESKYIYTNKLQAVFLNTGQVYFGKITELNNNFYVLTDIFYLQTNSSSTTTTTSTSSNNVSLVKLGCELHMPYDQMVINTSQVTFWENLQSNGQVAQAVAKYNSEHPNGQDECTDQSNSASTNSGDVQNATK